MPMIWNWFEIKEGKRLVELRVYQDSVDTAYYLEIMECSGLCEIRAYISWMFQLEEKREIACLVLRSGMQKEIYF